MKRFVIGIGVLAAMALLVTATATAAKPPPPPPNNPTLTGENFTGTITSVSNMNCNQGDTSSSYSFDASGTAIGPYPGTFTEHVNVSQTNNGISSYPASFPGGIDATFNENQGTLSQLTANFTITSATGTVMGTKTLTANAGDFGVCASSATISIAGFPFGTTPAEDFIAQSGNLTYNATITTAAGTSQDSGTASLAADQLSLPLVAPTAGPFQEDFASGVVLPPPGGPGNSPGTQNGKGCGDKNHAHTRMDQCKP